VRRTQCIHRAVSAGKADYKDYIAPLKNAQNSKNLKGKVESLLNRISPEGREAWKYLSENDPTKKRSRDELETFYRQMLFFRSSSLSKSFVERITRATRFEASGIDDKLLDACLNHVDVEDESSAASSASATSGKRKRDTTSTFAEATVIVAETLCNQAMRIFNGDEREHAADAFTWMMQAAENGNSSAMHCVAICFRDGVGIKQDSDKAYHFFAEATKLGNVDAMRCLGECLRDGVGTEINRPLAVEHFKEAASLGSEDAMYCLGVCYRGGVGVVPDKREASQWFKRAASTGHVVAKCS